MDNIDKGEVLAYLGGPAFSQLTNPLIMDNVSKFLSVFPGFFVRGEGGSGLCLLKIFQNSYQINYKTVKSFQSFKKRIKRPIMQRGKL